MNFNGAAKPLEDIDLPEIGSLIGVGEDEIHALLDTESSGHGFDPQGRPKMLFEPHIFYRHLVGDKLNQAVAAGLAYQNWGEQPYPSDSYPRLLAAIAIDETAALMSASWGLGQILGLNYATVGYSTPQAMVTAFCDSERMQLKAIVDFLKSNHLDGALRSHDWAAVAAGYEGPGYAKTHYDKKLEASFKHWQTIKDTPMPANTSITQPPQGIPLPPTRKEISMLSGYKTYITALVTVIGAVAAYVMGSADLSATVQLVVTALMGTFIRIGVAGK